MRPAIGIVGKGGIGAALLERRSSLGDGAPRLLFPAEVGLEALAAEAGVILVDGQAEEVLASLAALRPLVGAGATVVAVADGVDLAGLREAAGPAPAIVRAVAVPALLPEGGTLILCTDDGSKPDTAGVLTAALSSVGLVTVVAEDQLEQAAALARSALALLLVALQGIQEGAVSAGLPTETAAAFATQTLLTTALLLQSRGGSPADLKDQVASPAGTTIAGLAVLEEQGVRGAFIRAMEQAARPGSAVRRGVRPAAE